MDLPNLLFDLAHELVFDLGFLCKLGLGNIDFPLSLPIKIDFSLRKRNEGEWAEGGV